MISVYFSGSGNTKYCVNRLCKRIGQNIKAYSIEDEDIISKILKEDEIIFAYPTHYSNMPYMVREFIINNKNLWKGKRIFCLVTMGLFSGDGAGCSARLLKKYGAKIMGGYHIKMPDSICDCKALKKDSIENIRIIKNADKKIDNLANMISNGKYPKKGIKFHNHIIGLFGQRLWFYGKTNKYYKKLKIDYDKCSGCGNCIRNCPMNNLKFDGNKVIPGDRCTMCYRCANSCPKKAITIIGNNVHSQLKIESLLKEKVE